MNEKILYVTDHNQFTGFGRVGDAVCNGLATAGFDVYFLGWGFRADGIYPRGRYKLIPCGNAPFGEDALPFILQQIKPEVLVTQADCRMLMWVPDMLKQIPNKPTWIFYPVIDGTTWDAEGKYTKWPSNWLNVIKQADKVIAMTQYGQRILRENGVDASYIYHGVDTSLYKPVAEDVKAQIKKQVNLSEDAFIFGGVFKNMARKCPEKYLQAFKILLSSKNLTQAEKDKMVLVLHTQPLPASMGEFDLVQHAKDYGLEPGKNVLFSTMPLPQEVMPSLYKSMDVFIHLGTMEGFGLPLIEAMSTGLPVIGVDSCTMTEIIGDCGLLTKVPTYNGKHKISFGSYNAVECDIVNPWEVAKKMEQLYKDPALRKELGFKAAEKAVHTFDWSVILKQWVDAVKSCIITDEMIPAEWAKLYQETKV